MSSPLSSIDRELLGEVPNDTGAETITVDVGLVDGAQEESHGTGFTAINEAADALVKMSSDGDDVYAGKVSQRVQVPPHSLSTLHHLLSLSSPHSKASACITTDDSTPIIPRSLTFTLPLRVVAKIPLQLHNIYSVLSHLRPTSFGTLQLLFLP